jgi:hypothetical protein
MMPPEDRGDHVIFEVSVAHDEGRPLAPTVVSHLEQCDACAEFAEQIDGIDRALAAGDFSRTPDVAPAVMERATRQKSQWWSVAAVALIGIVVGALVGGVGTRLDQSLAQDLRELFHSAGTDLNGLRGDLIVVERGLHPQVPERVYAGTIDYVAPEQLSISLVDTTVYPDSRWLANDVSLTISNGDMITRAGSACPVAALPDCLVEATTRAIQDQPPFDDGVLLPLEIVGPGRSLTWPSAFDVLGTTELQGRPAIQVRSTVAAVELIEAITGNGAWRDLHPTDTVLMWLDEETLVPLRIEVFAADSPERKLWQLRHDYEDNPGSDMPIFIVELAGLTTAPGQVDVEMSSDAPSRGFVDETVDGPEPELPVGFEPHRSGHWLLPDGERVELASWSDGRSWLMVETVDEWTETRLFGLSLPFIDPVDLGEGSVGYLSPSGDALAIHSDERDILVSGSVPVETLIEVAGSLGVEGLDVPPAWQEAATVDVANLPQGTLVPEVEGWSLLGRINDDGTTLLLTGGGARNVMISQTSRARLEAPTGPDYSEVALRGVDGRYNASESTLEWIEDGQLIQMRSETVGLAELIDLAETMRRR